MKSCFFAFATLLSVIASRHVAAQDTGNIPPPSASRGNSTSEVIGGAAKSVFQLKATVSDGVFCTGTAFLVSEDGLAVTNFHVIQDATAATAIFTDTNTTVPVELIAADPGLDLALVKVPLNAPEISGKITPLRIAKADPGIGVEVWAIGYPMGLGLTVTKGVVSGVRDFDKIPDKMRKIMRYDATSRWVQTDCAINHGNSGGPLIDARGEVVGVNTWFWPSGNSVYFALSGSHISNLLVNKEQRKLEFAKSDGKKPRYQERPGQGFPRLELAQTAKPAALLSSANALRLGYKCPACSGKGVTFFREQVGTSNSGGLVFPTFETRSAQCKKCQGAAYVETNTFWRLGTKLVDTLSKLDRDHQDSERATKHTNGVLQEVLRLPNGDLAKTLNSQAASTLSASRVRPGETALFHGTLLVDFASRDDTSVRMLGVKLTDKDLVVLVSNPVLIDATEGETVFVGGIIAGRTAGEDGDILPVLQAGFVLAPRDPDSLKK